MATIMIHTHEYYVKNPHHIIKKSVYENIIKICKKNKKRIGLSVCDVKTFTGLENLNFDLFNSIIIFEKCRSIQVLLRDSKKLLITNSYTRPCKFLVKNVYIEKGWE